MPTEQIDCREAFRGGWRQMAYGGDLLEMDAELARISTCLKPGSY